jgi:hypothetical protein
MGLHLKGMLVALSKNIRLGQKRLTVTNTLAYYDTELITTVKSLIVLDLVFAQNK